MLGDKIWLDKWEKKRNKLSKAVHQHYHSLDMSKDIEALKELDEIIYKNDAKILTDYAIKHNLFRLHKGLGDKTWLGEKVRKRRTLIQAVSRHWDVLDMYNKVEAIKELKEIIAKNDEKILTDYAIKHNLIRSEE